jgi:hypothetical protein
MGVSAVYNQHMRRSMAGFSEKSNENLDSAMLIEVVLTSRNKRNSTTTLAIRRVEV